MKQHQFRCNQDPDGTVVYDVVFTPEDGGQSLHKVHTLATGGATEVSGPDGQPLLLDPTQRNAKQNGSYQVVPIQLQPDDWSDDDQEDSDDNAPRGPASTDAVGAPNGGVAIDDTQTNVTGAMVESTLKAQGEKHFVSPKAAGGTVVLRASLPKDVHFDDYFVWEVTDAATGQSAPATQTSNDRVRVPRDVPGQYVVRVMARPADPAAAPTQEITRMNVWVVWCNAEPPHIPTKHWYSQTDYDIDHTGDDDTDISWSLLCDNGDQSDWFEFKFSIDTGASSLTDTSADIPKLQGGKTDSPPVPGTGQTSPSPGNKQLSGGATMKWDVSRRYSFVISNPSSIPRGAFKDDYGSIYKDPVPDGTVVRLPDDPLVGNDDTGTGDEDNDPYQPCSKPHLTHAVGQLTSSDWPALAVTFHMTGGQDGRTFEQGYYMQEFVRLQLGPAWFVVSDPLPWKIVQKAKVQYPAWVDDGSLLSTGN